VGILKGILAYGASYSKAIRWRALVYEDYFIGALLVFMEID